MFTDSVREAVALKKFSLISPILNGQVDNQKKYLEDVCKNPIEMPYYGLKRYAPKTLSNWVSEYISDGIEALKPGHRNDRGKSRKIDDELALKIKEKHTEFPRMKGNLLYENNLNSYHSGGYECVYCRSIKYSGRMAALGDHNDWQGRYDHENHAAEPIYLYQDTLQQGLHWHRQAAARA